MPALLVLLLLHKILVDEIACLLCRREEDEAAARESLLAESKQQVEVMHANMEELIETLKATHKQVRQCNTRVGIRV